MEILYRIINRKRVFAFLSKEQFLNFIDNEKKILVAINAEKLNKSDEKIDIIINENIGYPDGIGAVMALKRKGVDSIKIAGADFWLDIIKYHQESKSFYLIGSSKEVINKTVDNLNKDFPGINILGYRDGYLNEGDEDKLVDDFLKLQPDIIFVAMGSPKQEFLMNTFKSKYPALYMGLGGSFDVYTGRVQRAPKIYQDLCLEWFYRLLKEPTRWRRQLNLGQFLIKIVFNKL